MVEKRQLTDDEKRIMHRQEKNIESDISYLQEELEIAKYELETVLPHYIKKRTREIEKSKRDVTQALSQCKFTLDTVKDQIKNGVTPKEEKEDGNI